MSYRILAIDSGNTSIKWGMHINNQWHAQGKVFNNSLFLLRDEFTYLPEPEFIIISHVSRTVTRDQIQELTSIWTIKPYWILSQSFQCGVTNGYLSPVQLGSDRWATLIAAWRVEQQACMVVTVGTAVTIDVLSDSGQFIGGIILPGIHSMHKSIQVDTQLTDAEIGTFKNFPDNTNAAIYSGIINAIAGAIERMYSILPLRLGCSAGNCIISGGDSDVIIPYVRGIPVKFIENLALEGLIVIAGEVLAEQKDFFANNKDQVVQ